MIFLMFLVTFFNFFGFFTEQINHCEWVKDAVFYQIFPERFNNGDRSNDPTLASLRGAYPHDVSSEWHISPWTSDWYRLQPWEEANQKGFAYNAQRRRYGGDIQGILDKLDYLADLGINTIYINPIFHSPSLHKYDAAYYHHVDAYFGPSPQGDLEIIAAEDHGDPSKWQWTAADKLFLSLVKKAHQMNIRVILDGVFNHTGINFWAFKDVVSKGKNSKYRDWYTIKAWDNPATSENEFKYEGWAGVKELPELREDENGLIDPVKDHVFAVVSRWMDPNGDGNPSDGIDGWRLDVAEKVNQKFWRAFRKHVKNLNPEAYITGEIFWEDWQNYKMFDPNPWLQGDQFDGVMNYRWALSMSQYFIDRKKKISVDKFVTDITGYDKSYDPETRFQLLNLMDSHDTDRLASHIVNPDLFYDKMVNLHDNPQYDVRKPNEAEWKIFQLITKVQMTFPGVPMIYYGSEAGMWGADDPDERKPMVWPDFTYQDEIANISKTPRPEDSVTFDKKLYSHYKKLIKIRNNEISLRRGTIKFTFMDSKKDILVYERAYKNDIILCVVNNSLEKHSLSLPAVSGEKWIDLENDADVNFSYLELQPKSLLILKKTS
jgi:cyclomaltodextrinase / maltogenic alpha-amylase / neopullulanase